MGFFVNSVPFDIQISREESFNDFLIRVKEVTLETFRHQNYPLELVADELKIRYPEIPVSFNMTNIQNPNQMGEIESFEPNHISLTQDVKFDLEIYATECKNGIQFQLSYKKRLFRSSTIAVIAEEYIRMLNFFTDNPHDNYKKYTSSRQTGTHKKKIVWGEFLINNGTRRRIRC